MCLRKNERVEQESERSCEWRGRPERQRKRWGFVKKEERKREEGGFCQRDRACRVKRERKTRGGIEVWVRERWGEG